MRGAQAVDEEVKEEKQVDEEEEEDEEQGLTSAESDNSDEDEEEDEEEREEMKKRKQRGRLEWDSSSITYWSHTQAHTHAHRNINLHIHNSLCKCVAPKLLFLMKHHPLLDKVRSTESAAASQCLYAHELRFTSQSEAEQNTSNKHSPFIMCAELVTGVSLITLNLKLANDQEWNLKNGDTRMIWAFTSTFNIYSYVSSDYLYWFLSKEIVCKMASY